MKQPIRSLLIISGTALAAGAGGYYFGSHRGDIPPTGEASAAGKTRMAARAGKSSGTDAAAAAFDGRMSALLGTGPLTAENAGAATLRILGEPDDSLRTAAVGMLLGAMTAENADAIHQGFIDITLQTGKRYDGEWAMMLKRYGAERGVEGLNKIAAGNAGQNTALVLEGLAAADPAAAGMWLDEQHSDQEYRSAYLRGLCRNDPAAALTEVLTNDEHGEAYSAHGVMQTAIQVRGIAETQQLLQTVLDAAPPEAGASPGFRMLFDSLTDSLFHKHWTDGSVSQMCGWLEQQSDAPYMTDQIVAHAAHDLLLKESPAAAMDWLDRMNKGGNPLRGVNRLDQALSGSPALIESMREEDIGRYLKMSAHGMMRPHLIERLRTLNPAMAEALLLQPSRE